MIQLGDDKGSSPKSSKPKSAVMKSVTNFFVSPVGFLHEHGITREMIMDADDSSAAIGLLGKVFAGHPNIRKIIGGLNMLTLFGENKSAFDFGPEAKNVKKQLLEAFDAYSRASENTALVLSKEEPNE